VAFGRGDRQRVDYAFYIADLTGLPRGLILQPQTVDRSVQRHGALLHLDAHVDQPRIEEPGLDPRLDVGVAQLGTPLRARVHGNRHQGEDDEHISQPADGHGITSYDLALARLTPWRRQS